MEKPMKERPVLFSAPMVRALLEGRKTQTRRAVKVDPDLEFLGWCTDTTGDQRNIGAAGFVKPPMDANPTTFARNRYGQPGDRLWVRETSHHCPHCPDGFWAYRADGWVREPSGASDDGGDRDDSDDSPLRPKCAAHGWTPSIHVPRKGSRIDLEVIGTRVERLHAITEADARAEGMESDDFLEELDRMHSIAPSGISCTFPNLRDEFQRIWCKINGYKSWDANPWVWVVEFRRIR